MRYELLPPPGATGGTPKKPTSAPAKVVAGHLMSKIGRPNRSRRTVILSLLLATVIFGLLLGRRHTAELQLAAATLSSYVPDSVTEAFIHHAGEYENIRWDDDVESKDTSNTVVKKPKFHLLIPAKKPTAKLCKTMLSAAILNYPPPTLISYGAPGGNERPGADVVKNTFNFLLGREAHEDDLILVVEEDAWLQLPAEVTINRFSHGMSDFSAKLLEKYGTVKDENSTVSKHPQKYTQRVLFGAAKECSNDPEEPACYSAPESPLPTDIYGDETDKHSDGKYNRPRYVGSSMVMGRVSDLRLIYKHATELLEFDNIGAQGSQYIFSKIFGEQELARQIYAASSPKNSRWPWLSSSKRQPSTAPNATLPQETNVEFGIGLDYHSSIFQSMNNSAEDIRFLTFNHPS